MMSLSKHIAAVGLGLGTLLVGSGLLAAEAPDFQAADTVRSLLERHQGKEVSLHLAGGGEIAGRVAAVGQTTVYISGLAGKEFYDAVVSLDKISAVTFRARTN